MLPNLFLGPYKKIPITALVFATFVGIVGESSAQMNRRVIKRNNKRLSGYRGERSVFEKEKRYIYLGISMDALNYYGDLSPLQQHLSTDITFTRPGWGFSVGKRFGPRYTLQSQFLWGTLRGSDAGSSDPHHDVSHYRYLRNLSFRNRIKEFSLLAYFDYFDNQGNYLTRMRWTPYVFSGISVFLHNPEAIAPRTDLHGNPLAEAGRWVPLRPLGTEGQHAHLDPSDANYGIKPYSLLQIAVPLGMGLRMKVSNSIDFWADISLRYCFTDYLDDVSRNYVDLGVLDSPLAQAMSYRLSELGSPSNPGTYKGRDGLYYTVQNGYGSEYAENIRGNKSAFDTYVVTSLRLTYVISSPYHAAKHR